MYRSLAWYCLKKGVVFDNEKAIASLCRRWKTELRNENGHVRLYVDGYYPGKEIRTAETSAAVPSVAAVPGVRKWMKARQRDCTRFGNLVMEGRDIGSNVFPDTEYKFYLDASLRAGPSAVLPMAWTKTWPSETNVIASGRRAADVFARCARHQ
ncbi:MAG: hypothetical protein CM1200mP29_15310 [Verrucomicrobiota bacterium]|nr:MAG: hypothetical protein CM1200mP29_15310 [Verrucomicrobiota bacterium]